MSRGRGIFAALLRAGRRGAQVGEEAADVVEQRVHLGRLHLAGVHAGLRQSLANTRAIYRRSREASFAARREWLAAANRACKRFGFCK